MIWFQSTVLRLVRRDPRCSGGRNETCETWLLIFPLIRVQRLERNLSCIKSIKNPFPRVSHFLDPSSYSLRNSPKQCQCHQLREYVYQSVKGISHSSYKFYLNREAGSYAPAILAKIYGNFNGFSSNMILVNKLKSSRCIQYLSLEQTR